MKGAVCMKKLFALTLTVAVLLTALAGCGVLEKFLNSEEIQNPSENQHKNEIKNPPVFSEIGNSKINSLDKLNYYAAVCVLSGTPTPARQNAQSGNSRFSLLTAYDTDYDTDEYEKTDDTLGEPEDSEPENNIYFYELSHDDVFAFDNVSMFQIELKDESGFLAAKLGIGTVDVVITEDCIWGDSLITFRNGEKFYSCLSNGRSYDRETNGCKWAFSTHKFVEGFYVVKNLEQENYAFYIEMDSEGQAIGFECGESEQGGDRVDRDVEVISSTVISTDGGSFTIAELEAYFKKDDYSDGNESSSEPSEQEEDV